MYELHTHQLRKTRKFVNKPIWIVYFRGVEKWQPADPERIQTQPIEKKFLILSNQIIIYRPNYNQAVIQH